MENEKKNIEPQIETTKSTTAEKKVPRVPNLKVEKIGLKVGVRANIHDADIG